MARDLNPPGLDQLQTFGREEFIGRRFRYVPGEHVSILGPTGVGKTTLATQLLAKVATPELPVIVLVSKPEDETAVKMGRQLQLERTRSWPPSGSRWIPWRQTRPRGWLLWPPHTFTDPEQDDAVQEAAFRSALLDSYKRGRRIVFADEVDGIHQDLGLDRELRTMWRRARAMRTGLWAATQRPSGVPLLMYSQAQHLFLHRNPDKRDADRYREIGGVNPDLVSAALERTKQFQWLYIRREGPRMCIIDSE